MKTLIFALLGCVAFVQGQDATQTGVGPGTQQPTQGNPSFLGYPNPNAPVNPGGQPFLGYPGGGAHPGLGYPYPGYPGQPLQPQSVFVIDNRLGKRCIAGLPQYRTVITGADDFSVTGSATECPEQTGNQIRYTTKATNVYVINQGGSRMSLCTFNRELFLQLANMGTAVDPTLVSRGLLFQCNQDGILDPSLAAPVTTNPNLPPTAANPGSFNPYGVPGYTPGYFPGFRNAGFGAPGFGGGFPGAVGGGYYGPGAGTAIPGRPIFGRK